MTAPELPPVARTGLGPGADGARAAVPPPERGDPVAREERGRPLRSGSARLERAAHRLPDWMGSVRFRLTALYSLVLFGLAAMVIGGMYLALASRLDDEPMSRDVTVFEVEPGPSGPVLVDPDRVRINIQTFEQRVNERSLQLLRSYSFGALALLFLSSLVVGWIVAGRVLAPIDRIIAVAREIQATDLSRRIALEGPPDELKHLADTFDSMLGRIDDAFENQRRFIQEASHELRNPLAVIRTNLDVALDDPETSSDDLRRTAEVVQRTAERMSHLVDDLLAYARQGDTMRAFANVDMAQVVSDTAAEFAVPAAARGLHLVPRFEAGLWVIGDRVALRQALANLLANAVRLAPEATTIRVSAGRRIEASSGPRVWVTVQDEGPGIGPGDRDLVFQRFWRGDGRRAREEGRSGLGLTIVRQIAESHRGEVQVEPNPTGGSTFSLSFPAADPPDTTS
ncbi:MAG: HAMP domain-containing sensor histidine kinase [Acidimicrobiales bacterium]